MALGTVVAIGPQIDMGGLTLQMVEVQPTSGANYTTNGEAFDIAQVPGGKGTLIGVFPSGNSTVGGNGAIHVWDPANKKLKAYGTAVSASGLTEIAASVDLSAARVRFLCISTGIG